MGKYEDCLKLFGLSEDASQDDIKKAYKREALRVHPDKNPDDPDATTSFQHISESYTFLMRGGEDDDGEEDEFFEQDDFLVSLLKLFTKIKNGQYHNCRESSRSSGGARVIFTSFGIIIDESNIFTKRARSRSRAFSCTDKYPFACEVGGSYYKPKGKKAKQAAKAAKPQWVNEPSQKFVKKKLKREWNLYRNEYQSDSEEDTFEESTKHFRQNSYSEPDRQQFNNNDQAESNRERKKKPSKPREEKKRQPTLPQPVKMSKKEIQAEQSKRNREIAEIAEEIKEFKLREEEKEKRRLAKEKQKEEAWRNKPKDRDVKQKATPAGNLEPEKSKSRRKREAKQRRNKKNVEKKAKDVNSCGVPSSEKSTFLEEYTKNEGQNPFNALKTEPTKGAKKTITSPKDRRPCTFINNNRFDSKTSYSTSSTFLPRDRRPSGRRMNYYGNNNSDVIPQPQKPSWQKKTQQQYSKPQQSQSPYTKPTIPPVYHMPPSARFVAPRYQRLHEQNERTNDYSAHARSYSTNAATNVWSERENFYRSAVPSSRTEEEAMLMAAIHASELQAKEFQLKQKLEQAEQLAQYNRRKEMDELNKITNEMEHKDRQKQVRATLGRHISEPAKIEVQKLQKFSVSANESIADSHNENWDEVHQMEKSPSHKAKEEEKWYEGIYMKHSSDRTTETNEFIEMNEKNVSTTCHVETNEKDMKLGAKVDTQGHVHKNSNNPDFPVSTFYVDINDTKPKNKLSNINHYETNIDSQSCSSNIDQIDVKLSSMSIERTDLKDEVINSNGASNWIGTGNSIWSTTTTDLSRGNIRSEIQSKPEFSATTEGNIDINPPSVQTKILTGSALKRNKTELQAKEYVRRAIESFQNDQKKKLNVSENPSAIKPVAKSQELYLPPSPEDSSDSEYSNYSDSESEDEKETPTPEIAEQRCINMDSSINKIESSVQVVNEKKPSVVSFSDENILKKTGYRVSDLFHSQLPAMKNKTEYKNEAKSDECWEDGKAELPLSTKYTSQSNGVEEVEIWNSKEEEDISCDSETDEYYTDASSDGNDLSVPDAMMRRKKLLSPSLYEKEVAGRTPHHQQSRTSPHPVGTVKPTISQGALSTQGLDDASVSSQQENRETTTQRSMGSENSGRSTPAASEIHSGQLNNSSTASPQQVVPDLSNFFAYNNMFQFAPMGPQQMMAMNMAAMQQQQQQQRFFANNSQQQDQGSNPNSANSASAMQHNLVPPKMQPMPAPFPGYFPMMPNFVPMYGFNPGMPTQPPAMFAANGQNNIRGGGFIQPSVNHSESSNVSGRSPSPISGLANIEKH